MRSLEAPRGMEQRRGRWGSGPSPGFGPSCTARGCPRGRVTSVPSLSQRTLRCPLRPDQLPDPGPWALSNSRPVFPGFPPLPGLCVCLIGAETAPSCPREGTAGSCCPRGLGKAVYGAQLLLLPRVRSPHALLQGDTQESMKNKTSPARSLFPASSHRQKHLENPFSPPKQPQQLGLDPSTCSGFVPRLHPSPQSPHGGWLPPFPLSIPPSGIAQWSALCRGASPWLLGSVLSLPSKPEGALRARHAAPAVSGMRERLNLGCGSGFGML